MEFILRENTNISINHRFKEISLEIEDGYNDLEETLLRTIFENSGIKHLANTLDEDMFKELLTERQEELHDYLTKSGCIFNKA